MALILAILAALSLLLVLWQWVVAWRYPLHRRVSSNSFTPPVTLLKPLKGLDIRTLDCLRSWFTQDYPADVQVLFGVASAEDPVCPAVGRLIKENPSCNTQLIVCEESLGVNAKVSTLIQLMRSARHDAIVVSDADVYAPPDLLVNMIAPLQKPETGLVNCFYRLAEPSTLAMRWEAVAINADFWSQVLQGRSMQPLDFALGAVMAMRKAELAKIGGFECLADYLADDFQLGNRIARAGGQIALCPIVVDCISGPMGWREAWAHQLRWARTIRVSKPLPYAFSILSNATLWPLIWLVAEPSKWSVLGFGICLLARIVTAQTLQTRLGPTEGQGWYWWLAPLKDLLQFALWICAFFGNHIVWRGRKFQLLRDGRLVESVTATPAQSRLHT